MTDYGDYAEYGKEWGQPRRGPRSAILLAGFVGLVVLVFIVIGLSGGGAPTAPAADGPLRVVVSIPPLAWPVRELAPHAEVTILSGPGSSPHGMELTPSQVRALAEAHVVVLVGLGLDDAARRVAGERGGAATELVVLEESLAAARTSAHDHAADAHGASDPHAWLDPMVMRALVVKIDGALARATGGLVTGGALVQERCDAIDDLYALTLRPMTRRTIVCQHNAYGYLADRYGLDVAAVVKPFESAEVRPGDVKSVVDAIRKHRVGAIFVEPQTSGAISQRIAAETGVEVLVLDPIGDGNWPDMMRRNLDALVEGLSAMPPLSLDKPDEDADAE